MQDGSRDNPPVTGDTLAALLASRAAASGDAPALLALAPDGGLRQLGWRELLERARSAAAILQSAGTTRGEPVALIAAPQPDWVVAYFGILLSGAVPVLLDAQAGPATLAALLQDAGVRRVITLPAIEASLMARPGADWHCLPLADPGHWSIQARATRPLPEGTATLLYTSGTTGKPKGVPLSHANLLANVAALAATGLAGPADRVLLPLPLHHAYPLTVGLLGCVATGAAVVLPAGVTGPQLTTAIRSTGATVLIGVPRLFSALLTGIEARAGGGRGGALFRRLLDASTAMTRRTGLRAGRWLFAAVHRGIGPTLRLLVSGGARLDPATAQRLEGLGYEVLSGYGLSETAPVLTFNVRGHVRHASAGRPLPGVELRIDPAGEVQARGANIFAGYWNDAAATGGAFTPDGWFRTGDLGHIDDEGYLHITGRLRELLVLADGKKLLPESVEAHYAASPLLREVGLFELDGQLAAVVVPDDDAIRARGAAREAALIREELETLSTALPPWQRLSAYRVVATPLPRTTMGKLQRFQLPAIYRQAGALAAAPATAPSVEDEALLADPLAARAWEWLARRFAGKPFGLDASPQLDLQVDSLEWLALTLEIRAQFGVTLPDDAIARVLTVRDLLREIVAGAGAPAAAAAPEAATPATLAPPPWPVAAFGRLAYAVDRLLLRLVFRLRVSGREHLPARGPVIIAPNHASYLDPMAIAAALPWRLLPATHWAGWTAILFQGWLWRLFSRATRVFPVDPDRGPAAALACGRAVLARGDVLVWFPEGRRSRTGAVAPFLPGVGVLMAGSRCPVVPAWIEGSFSAWPWNARWPRPARISVRFGPPLSLQNLLAHPGGEPDPEALAAALRAAVEGLAGGGPTP
ncbi:MAG: AMP-binding protein [Chromatiales bacterium]|jgi:long-chain acyl-CoA synthetase|nr:AMP-binding protein [Chromatiales bacterium]